MQVSTLNTKRHGGTLCSIAALLCIAVTAFSASAEDAESPVCGPDHVIDGVLIERIEGLPNSFAYYAGANPESTSGEITKVNLYLEHCPTGRVLRVELDTKASREEIFAVRDFFWSRIRSSKKVTMRRLARELRELGAETKISTSKVESCACNKIFPEHRGSKQAYTGQ